MSDESLIDRNLRLSPPRQKSIASGLQIAAGVAIGKDIEGYKYNHRRYCCIK